MYNAVSQFLNAYNAVWSGNSTITGMVTAFNGHISALNASDMAQKTITSGITQSKEMAKAAMANAAMILVNAGKSYANAIHNVSLAANFDITYSDIVRARDTDADDICQNIHDALQPYIAGTAAYGANTASLSALQNAIHTFSGWIGKPRSQQSISINATLSIAQHFEAANALLKDQLDPIMAQYKTISAPFYNQYNAVRVIVDSGKQHSVIMRGLIYDGTTNAALANATVKMTGAATNEKTTDETGIYKFVRLQPGDYTITVSAKGYAAQSRSLSVKQNGTIDTDFKMVPVASSNDNSHNET